MNIPETYEEFLNLTLSEYKQICYQKQPKEVVSRIYSFYKQAKSEGKKLNTINEENKDKNVKFPNTYEEFLKTSDENLLNISRSKLSLKEAQILISYINRAEKEFGNKVISEEKRKNAKNQWERYNE